MQLHFYSFDYKLFSLRIFMKTCTLRRISISVIITFFCIINLIGKTSDIAAPVEHRDITYLSVKNHNLKLDVFQRQSSSPSPVLIYFHGGGWTANSRPASWTGFKYYLSLGFSIVNVDYRLAADAPAPAAVQDCRAALAWVGLHAEKYKFDRKRIVVYGTSAGGHLAMMAGIVPSGADFDLPQCKTMPRVAAIIDFYGITDVNDLLDGANKRGWATTWIGRETNRSVLAIKMSPLQYISENTPPIIIVHGDSDPTVPYEHALRLAKSCEQNKVTHKLVTIKGGQHGNFSRNELNDIEKEINIFLKETGIIR
jgi:acetyl esterase/lipase